MKFAPEHDERLIVDEELLRRLRLGGFAAMRWSVRRKYWPHIASEKRTRVDVS